MAALKMCKATVETKSSGRVWVWFGLLYRLFTISWQHKYPKVNIVAGFPKRQIFFHQCPKRSPPLGPSKLCHHNPKWTFITGGGWWPEPQGAPATSPDDQPQYNLYSSDCLVLTTHPAALPMPFIGSGMCRLIAVETIDLHVSHGLHLLFLFILSLQIDFNV